MYLTTAYLTSLDTYYKLYNFSFDSYKYKSPFLNDIINYLQSFNRRTDIEQNLNNLKNRISFTNEETIHWSFICNKRIFDEMPKPNLETKNSTEVFFTYTSERMCSETSNGIIRYRIGTSLDTSTPSEILETLTDFWAYANKRKMFRNIEWSKVPTREDVITHIVQWLASERIINENQQRAVEYLNLHLKHDLMKKLPPIIELECIVPDMFGQVRLRIPTETPCVVQGFSNSFPTVYSVDLMSLFRTLRRVESGWMQRIIPLLTSENAAQKLGISYPLPPTSKANFFKELLDKLAALYAELVPPSFIEYMKNEIQTTGYGEIQVEMLSNCPVNQYSARRKEIQQRDAKPCQLNEIPSAEMGYFVHLPTMFTAFQRSTSKKLLKLYSKILNQPNSYQLLPNITPCNVTNLKFNEIIINHLLQRYSDTPMYKRFFIKLLESLNQEDRKDIIAEKQCTNAHLTAGSYLKYPAPAPAPETCSTRNFDLELSDVIASLDKDTSQNQILLLSSYFLNKHKVFYEALSTVDVNHYETTGTLLKAIIEAYQPIADKEEQVFLQTLLPHILPDQSPPLTVITECPSPAPTMEQLLNLIELEEALQNPESDPFELSFRMMSDDNVKDLNLEFKAKENAAVGQRKLKETLYSLFGGPKDLSGKLNLLQKANLDASKLYDGFDVINELPDKFKVILLLNRYLKSVPKDPEVVEAVKTVLKALDSEVSSIRSRRGTPSTQETFNLDRMLQPVKTQLPHDIQQAYNSLSKSIGLQNVTVGPAYSDLLPFILKADTPRQISILLKILYDTRQLQLSRTDVTNLKELHNYFSPDENDFIDVEAHYARLVYLLNGFLDNNTNKEIIDAKNTVITFIKAEKDFDRGISRLDSLQLKPKEYLIRSLRRFREILNKKSDKDVSRLWVATTKLLHHFQTPDHDPTENEIEEDVDIVGLFRALDDELVVQAKGVLLKYLIQNSEHLSEVFAGMREINSYTGMEKVAIILSRLSQTSLDMPWDVQQALRDLTKFVEQKGFKETDSGYTNFNIQGVIESVFKSVHYKQETVAKEYLLKAVRDHPDVFTAVLRQLVLTDYETSQQQLTEILRRLHEMYNSKLSPQLLWAVNATLSMMDADLTDPSDDQFLGDFLPHLNNILRDALPDNLDMELSKAFETVKVLMREQQHQFSASFKGIFLHKHPRDLQARIIIKHLEDFNSLSAEQRRCLDVVRNFLDFTSTEVEDETINEKEMLKELFRRVFNNTQLSSEIYKAQSVILHYLSPGNKYQKTAYRGVRYKTSDENVLEQIFNNILYHPEEFDKDVLDAIRTVAEYLSLTLTEFKNPTSLEGIQQSFQKVFSNVTGEYREALQLVLLYCEHYPASMDKILVAAGASVGAEEKPLEVVSKVLSAVQQYEQPVSVSFRGAASILLQKFEAMTGSKSKIRKSREDVRQLDNKDQEELKYQNLKEATLRILLFDNDVPTS